MHPGSDLEHAPSWRPDGAFWYLWLMACRGHVGIFAPRNWMSVGRIFGRRRVISCWC